MEIRDEILRDASLSSLQKLFVAAREAYPNATIKEIAELLGCKENTLYKLKYDKLKYGGKPCMKFLPFDKIKTCMPNGTEEQYSRAKQLATQYYRSDFNMNRECNITPQWIVNNIFTKKCYWCGESDWSKLGCDRIDNSKGHIIGNMIPCCGTCNKNRRTQNFRGYHKVKHKELPFHIDNVDKKYVV